MLIFYAFLKIGANKTKIYFCSIFFIAKTIKKKKKTY